MLSGDLMNSFMRIEDELRREVAHLSAEYESLANFLLSVETDEVILSSFAEACNAGVLSARDFLKRQQGLASRLRYQYQSCETHSQRAAMRKRHQEEDERRNQDLAREYGNLQKNFEKLKEPYKELHELQLERIEKLRAQLCRFEIDSIESKETLLKFLQKWERQLVVAQQTNRGNENDIMTRQASMYVEYCRASLRARFENQ